MAPVAIRPLLIILATLPTLALTGTLPTLALTATLPTLALTGTLPALVLTATLPTQALTATLPTLDRAGTLPTLARAGTLPAPPVTLRRQLRMNMTTRPALTLPSTRPNLTLPATLPLTLPSPTTHRQQGPRALAEVKLPTMARFSHVQVTVTETCFSPLFSLAFLQ